MRRARIHSCDSGLPWLSIFLISAGALAYELLLMRLLAIVQWHHFGYMIISLALLGYGASGTLIAIARSFLLRHFDKVYIGALTCFGIGSVGAFLLAQEIPFNPEEMLWSLTHLPRLFAIYLLLALPFLCAATCVGIALTRYSGQIPRLYATDLLGAGCGSLVVVIALLFVSPPLALRLIGAFGLMAAAVACWELQRRSWIAFVVALLTLSVLLPSAWFELRISPYKPLSQALQIGGTRIVSERSGPLGLLTVVENRDIPWRHAPGLSVNARSGIPEQLAVFTDGNAMSTIARSDTGPGSLAFTDQFSSALAYHMAPLSRVVILRAGTGVGILQALFHAIPEIVAVEANPDLIALLTGPYREFSGNLYERPTVRRQLTGPRSFAAVNRSEFDLIQLTLGAGSTSALGGLSESYALTVEALGEYIEDLKPSGYLSLTGWVRAPPRDGLKVLAAAIRALEINKATAPGEHLIFIRGWQTFTLLLKKTPLTDAEIGRAREFAKDRSFDLGHYPGIVAGEANRHNVLQDPYYYLAAKALLGERRGEFLASYKYDLRPARDDRPYFGHYFLWRSLSEIVSLRGRGGVPLLEAAYLVLIATLAQASIAALILIVAPLIFLPKAEPSGPRQGPGKVRILSYFLAVGLGYMLIEIASMQALSRILDHPIYSAAVVLTGFLLFSGLGSLWSQWLAARYMGPGGLRWPICALIATALMSGALFTHQLDWLAAAPFAARVCVSMLAIGPMAFFMGIPFPLALARVGRNHPELVPWAWGVNGCASVIGPVLAMILALHFGLAALVLIALGFYAATLLVTP